MDTNLKISIGFILIVLVFGTIYITSLPLLQFERSIENTELYLSSPGGIVVDKVYNFTIEDPQLDFDNNLFFNKHYYYDIMVVVVTPHTCDLDIRIWDPEGDEFFITSETNMVQFDYRTIPFGTALEGNYSARFEATISQNVNFHIRIEKKDKCLYDKIEFDERDDIRHYNVTKFYNEMTIDFTLYFETDMYYKFFFERVSTISIELSSYVAIDHDVLDPQDIDFQIYRNESFWYLNYYIGTAVAGFYTMDIAIYCDVDCVNIAYAVVEKEVISNEVDPNDDDPPPDDPPPNNTSGGITAFIPFEGTLTVLTLVGIGVCVPVAMVIYRRKRNTSGL